MLVQDINGWTCFLSFSHGHISLVVKLEEDISNICGIPTAKKFVPSRHNPVEYLASLRPSELQIQKKVG